MKEVSVCFGEAVVLVISFPAERFHNRTSSIVGLQARDKAAMLVVNTIIVFFECYRQMEFGSQRREMLFVLIHQYGRHDFTCK